MKKSVIYEVFVLLSFSPCCSDCFLLQVFTEYFKELEEESIRDNFVLIYELFDELMDFGYPQTTETKILQEYAPVDFRKDLNTGFVLSLVAPIYS